jgi:hypothetical protein
MTADELLADYDSDVEAAYEANLPPHHRRLCQTAKADEFSSALHAASVAATLQDISAKKFLEVSLNTLDTIGRQQFTGSPGPHGASVHGQNSTNTSKLNVSALNADEGIRPSDHYLKGAIWIARNLVMVTEEMWDSISDFRDKHLSEVANAAHDTDPRRSSHRLNLLAGAGINQSLAIVGSGRVKTREIINVSACSLISSKSACVSKVCSLR